MLLNVFDQRDAVSIGQFHVRQAQVEGFVMQNPRGVAVVFGAARFEAHA